VIFTDELTLRLLDWPDWCMLTHAKKKESGVDAGGHTGTHSSRTIIRGHITGNGQCVRANDGWGQDEALPIKQFVNGNTLGQFRFC
jgi:hypothetical protein